MFVLNLCLFKKTETKTKPEAVNNSPSTSAVIVVARYLQFPLI